MSRVSYKAEQKISCFTNFWTFKSGSVGRIFPPPPSHTFNNPKLTKIYFMSV